MLGFPNCKINIGLYITRRREDGYHDLETVFYPLPFHDVLELMPAHEQQLHLYGRSVAGEQKDNIVCKAVELIRNTYPDAEVPTLQVHLLKNIPMGAGLGGGSADGAFALRMLNEQFNLNISQHQLAALALQLGSDCPFFIYNKPQFASGRGEQMSTLDLDLSSYSIQLLCPQLHVSTAKAFQLIKPRQTSFDLRTLSSLPLENWKEHISNDFEAPVFQQYPQLAAYKEQFYEQGAIYASMSGSGSALYGIFPKGQKAVFEEGLETHYFN